MRILKTMMLAMAVIVCSFATASCMAGKKLSGEVISLSRQVEYYNKVESTSFIDVVFMQGAKPSVRIEGDKTVVDFVEVKQTGDKLIVGFKKGTTLNYSGNAKLKVYLTSPDLVAVSLLGSGDFEMRGNLDTDNLDIAISGSGDAEFDRVVCDNLSCRILGSGDVKISSGDAKQAQLTVNGSGDVKMVLANADAVNLKLNGSGDVKGRYVRCASLDCVVNGSGDVEAELTACGDVHCVVNGSGDVELKGTARSLTKAARGSGEVDTTELRVK